MIKLMSLKHKHIGRWVQRGREIGRIKSYSPTWIYVVYHCNNDWDNYMNYTGCATDPDDLVFIKEPNLQHIK